MTTTVLFLRHEEHVENRLTPNGIVAAHNLGKGLKAMGISPEVLISSPQWRCIETIQNVMIGYGFMIPLTKIDHRFGDIKLDQHVDPQLVDRILQMAAEEGVEKEIIYFKDKAIRADLIRRGEEGAKAIFDALSEYRGKTLLICSHGGSRMEPIICALTQQDILNPPFVFKKGSLALLVFNQETLVSLNIQHKFSS